MTDDKTIDGTAQEIREPAAGPKARAGSRFPGGPGWWARSRRP